MGTDVGGTEERLLKPIETKALLRDETPNEILEMARTKLRTLNAFIRRRISYPHRSRL